MKHKIKALEALIMFANDMEKDKYSKRKRKKKPEDEAEEPEATEE